MDGLTDAELAALELDDNGDEKGAAGSDTGGNAGDSDGAGTGTGAGEQGAGAGTDADGANSGGDGNGAGSGADEGAGAAGDGNDAGNGAAAGEGAGAGAAADAQSRPLFVAEAPEGAETRLKEIGDKKAELRKQYDDGDITFDEYDSAKDLLSTEERKLERQIDQANISASMQQQQAKNDWDAAVSGFLAANDAYKNPVLYRALDAEVKRVAGEEGSKGFSFQQILDEAHKSIASAFGLKKDDPKPNADAGKTQQRKQPDLPPTLRNIPAAEHADTSGNKYAALDRLAETDPAAYEAAMLKMSKAERDAYCAA